MNDDLKERLDKALHDVLLFSKGMAEKSCLQTEVCKFLPCACISDARSAVFAELAAAGYAVVPREPTEAMLVVNEDDAFSSNPECTIHARRKHWRAMIAAAEQGQER